MALRPGLFVTNDANTLVGPKDARLALAGLLSGPGVLRGGVVSGASSGPNIRYNLAPGVFVCERGDRTQDGLYVLSNDSQLTLDSGVSAPNSGSRIDLIWVRQKNSYAGDGFGDNDSDAEAGVTVGGAGANPVPPTGSLPPGALVLAEAVVSQGDGAGEDAQITLVADKVTAPANLLDADGVLPVARGGTGWDDVPDMYFLRGSSTAGVLAQRSPEQVLQDLQAVRHSARTVANWNAAVDSGFYESFQGLNQPTPNDAYQGVVWDRGAGSTGTVTQLVSRATGTGRPELYVRIRKHSSSSWGPWQQIYGDTGWLNCTVSSGTGTIRARLLNGVVHLKGQLNDAASVSASLPAGIPGPSVGVSKTSAIGTSGSTTQFNGIYVSPGGSISGSRWTTGSGGPGVTAPYEFDGLNWPVD